MIWNNRNPSNSWYFSVWRCLNSTQSCPWLSVSTDMSPILPQHRLSRHWEHCVRETSCSVQILLHCNKKTVCVLMILLAHGRLGERGCWRDDGSWHSPVWSHRPTWNSPAGHVSPSWIIKNASSREDRVAPKQANKNTSALIMEWLSYRRTNTHIAAQFGAVVPVRDETGSKDPHSHDASSSTARLLHKHTSSHDRAAAGLCILAL